MANDETRSLPHIYLPEQGEPESFTSPRGGGGETTIPQRDRARHAEQLERALARALVNADAQIAARNARTQLCGVRPAALILRTSVCGAAVPGFGELDDPSCADRERCRGVP